ncbi:MAG: GNAT family N-acetyltransferase [Pikeienuella sp.]
MVGKVPIAQGWAPGLLGWAVAEQSRTYAACAGFGLAFEAKIAREMAAFLERLAPPGVQIFHASDDVAFLATAAIDAADDRDGLAHLRWVITAARGRGRGLGTGMVAAAVQSARAAGCSGVWLETFSGLDAARRLYERAGFRLVHEAHGETWGQSVREQRFELRF